jgi:hypothetical protein
MITVRTAINGWVLELQSDVESIETYVFSYQDDPSDEDEVKTFASLLRRIDSLIGPSTSRYSEHRVYVDVRPGDKYSVIRQEED